MSELSTDAQNAFSDNLAKETRKQMESLRKEILGLSKAGLEVDQAFFNIKAAFKRVAAKDMTAGFKQDVDMLAGKWEGNYKVCLPYKETITVF